MGRLLKAGSGVTSYVPSQDIINSTASHGAEKLDRGITFHHIIQILFLAVLNGESDKDQGDAEVMGELSDGYGLRAFDNKCCRLFFNHAPDAVRQLNFYFYHQSK